MNNKNKIITFTITFTFFLSIAGLVLFINYFRDPLQIFSENIDDTRLVSNARHQSASLIRLHTFDSFILGTSMLENTSSHEASSILGGKFMNLSLSGSDFNTRALVLEYALKKTKIKKIIYSLDSNSLVDSPIADTSNFDFLYDDNRIDDIKIYLNIKYIKCIISDSCYMKNFDIDKPFAWEKDKEHSKRFGGLDNWFKSNNNKVKTALKSILETIKKIEVGKKKINKNNKDKILLSQKYMDDTLIKFISKYPDAEFILILPPYSRIAYAISAQYYISSFEGHRESIKYLVNKSNEHPNLKIYGWGNHSFVDDIANYKDLSHYGYKINSWMLGAIKREEGLLVTDNIDNYLEVFSKKAVDYDLSEVGKKIDKYLNTK